MTRDRLQARYVPGLIFPAVPPPGGSPYDGGSPYSNSGSYANYPRGGYPSGDNGSSDLTQAWVFCVLGLICCPIVFNTLGWQAANRAAQKGNPGGETAKIANIVVGIVSMALGASALARR